MKKNERQEIVKKLVLVGKTDKEIIDHLKSLDVKVSLKTIQRDRNQLGFKKDYNVDSDKETSILSTTRHSKITVIRIPDISLYKVVKWKDEEGQIQNKISWKRYEAVYKNVEKEILKIRQRIFDILVAEEMKNNNTLIKEAHDIVKDKMKQKDFKYDKEHIVIELTGRMVYLDNRHVYMNDEVSKYYTNFIGHLEGIIEKYNASFYINTLDTMNYQWISMYDEYIDLKFHQQPPYHEYTDSEIIEIKL